MKHWVWVALAALGLMGVPAFGADYPTNSANTRPAEPAFPGTLNYIEGAVTLDGHALNNQPVGNIAMKAGDVLSTGAGKAEILLTPGIFLRVGSNSEIKMISPDIEATRVELDHGRAAVEVDQIFPQNMVQIVDNGETSQLMKTGYYEFNATPPEIKVFKGEARIKAGVGIHVGEGKWGKVKGGHELALDPAVREKEAKFDRHTTQDALYNWSSLRSRYIAEANNQIAGEYAYAPGFNPGWYWDPYMMNYTYLGLNTFYSPFGWGFYPWGGFYGGLGFYGGGPWYGFHGWDDGHPWHGGTGGHVWHGGRGSRTGVWPAGRGFGADHEAAGHGFTGGGGSHGGTGFHGGSSAGGGGRR
ncbi:MAG: FecR domain-containing protein [Terracidiphilus sp.]